VSVDTNISILLVENSNVMRKMEANVLTSLGFSNITEAENGRYAVEIITKNPKIDLIICDWDMPEMDGYEFLVWIRKEQNTSHIPFIMATGRAEKKMAVKANDAGVSAFVTKPFSPNELHIKIEEALGIRKSEKEIVRKRELPTRNASGKLVLKACHIQITDHIVLGVLKELIRRGTYSPNHFDIETECMPSWNPVAKALESGSVDIAFVLAPIAMDIFNFNVPIKLILLAHKGGSIFVRNKLGKYEQPYGNFFRNKSFMIPHSLSVHSMLAHKFLSQLGLKPGTEWTGGTDVIFEITPPVKMPEFLGKNESASGFMVAEPIGTKAIAGGLAEQMFLSNEMWENHPCCVVAIQQDIIDHYPEAVFELTDFLVKAGQLIADKPGFAAEIGVPFLDPMKTLGLKVPLLKNVLTDPLGIRTGDLMPSKRDLNEIQTYLYNEMGTGSIIDIDSFVDLRFAEAAYKEMGSVFSSSAVMRDTKSTVEQIINRQVVENKEDKTKKTTLDKVGKYLTLALGELQFGIDISKIREIIGMTTIRPVPQMPPFVRGVINLRGRVISVVDLRLRLGLEEIKYNERSCIIVLEVFTEKGTGQIGVAVDSVSEVLNIKAEDIEEPPKVGLSISTDNILAMSKSNDVVRILLDIDRVLAQQLP